MKAVILAAGRGSRLGPRTSERPKCLVELDGRTLFEWQRDALREAGVEEVVVVRGYRKESLPGGDYAVLDNPRWAETNMVMTLARAAEHLRDGPVIVAYADLVYHPGIVRSLADASGELAIAYDRDWLALWGDRFADPLSDAESFRVAESRVTEIGEKPRGVEEVEGQYMGLLRFTPTGWAAVEALLAALPAAESDRLDMTSLLRRLISAGTPITAVPVSGRWCEVDNESDLDLYEERLARAAAEGSRWSHDWRWSEGRGAW